MRYLLSFSIFLFLTIPVILWSQDKSSASIETKQLEKLKWVSAAYLDSIAVDINHGDSIIFGKDGSSFSNVLGLSSHGGYQLYKLELEGKIGDFRPVQINCEGPEEVWITAVYTTTQSNHFGGMTITEEYLTIVDTELEAIIFRALIFANHEAWWRKEDIHQKEETSQGSKREKYFLSVKANANCGLDAKVMNCEFDDDGEKKPCSFSAPEGTYLWKEGKYVLSD